MQELYFMQQIGTLLLQISGFLFVLLVLWIIAMAGAELFRDRINAGIEKNKRESETLEGKLLEEERRKKELEKIETVYDMKIRNVKFIHQHLKTKENNYRKMHGLPMIRRRWKHGKK